jgi:hypothetical protein
MLVRSLLLAIVCSFSFTLQAQQVGLPRFQVNFKPATPSAHQVSFNIEDDHQGAIDFIVLKNDEPIFRFQNIDYTSETLYSFVLVDDQNKAIEGLQQQTTLTTNSDFGIEIKTAFEDKTTTMVGILECTTKSGATSRMQVIKLVEADEENTVAGANK